MGEGRTRRREPAQSIADHRWQLLRFALVGAISSLSYSLLVAALVDVAPMPAYWVGLVAFLVFIPVTFQAHKHFSFRAAALRRAAFPGYVALQIACFAAISAVSTTFLTGIYPIDAALYFATVGLTALASFVIGRLFIFRPSAEATR